MGQDHHEEVNLVTKGFNAAWSWREGKFNHTPANAPFTPPVGFLGADPIVALAGDSGQIAIYSVPSLRSRWKRRRVVLQIQCFAGCRLAKTALQMYVPLRLVARFL